MNTHTPGPWFAHLSSVDAGHWRIQRKINGEKAFPSWAIALIPNYQNNDEANARLIAAAPDLLDFVKMIAKHCESPIGDCINVKRLGEMARAAIAKAEGTK